MNKSENIFFTYIKFKIWQKYLGYLFIFISSNYLFIYFLSSSESSSEDEVNDKNDLRARLEAKKKHRKMTAARLAIRVGATETTASEASEAPSRIVEMVPDDLEDEDANHGHHNVSQSILYTSNSKSSNNTEFENNATSTITKKSCCVKFVLWDELESNTNTTTENVKDVNEKLCGLDELV